MTSIARLASTFALAVLVSTSVACSGTTGPADPDTSDATGASADELSRSRFTWMRSGPTDQDLASLYAAGSKFEGAYMGVYRFNKAGPEATDEFARMQRVKEVMHRYMCSFFDESIDLGRATGSKRVDVTLADVDIEDNAYDQDADVAAFSSALTGVFGRSDLDVMSGGASGNNTAGEVMGVYDVTHNEILFFGFTNCGSDD
jgi:hypothetical protein